MMVLAGVLVFGTPAGVLAEEADHSMEGQISKPQSSGENNADGFVILYDHGVYHSGCGGYGGAV